MADRSSIVAKACERALVLSARGAGTRQQVRAAARGFVRRHRGDTAHADAFYGKFPSVMAPDDIARAVVYALDQPRGLTIAQMLVVPTREV